jgi:hypothetical protein
VLSVYCVLRQGGGYDPSWVAKLKRGVEKHLPIPHRFVCLSDVPVPCERIALKHDWPGWWSKVELFREGVVDPPALFFDLDNVVIRDLTPLTDLPYDFAMLRNFTDAQHASSCVMWFGAAAPAHVYEKFAADPQGWIRWHKQMRKGGYLGDQAFIADAVGSHLSLIDIPRFTVASYRYDLMKRGKIPAETVMIAFGGPIKPDTVPPQKWLEEAWA